VVSVALAERDSELEIGDMLAEDVSVLLAAARVGAGDPGNLASVELYQL